jgi:riboflavin synthase
MLLIEKGSICINGVSLTVFDVAENTFKVTIIPYTYENTQFKKLKEGDIVNVEFDMIGKYLARFNK